MKERKMEQKRQIPPTAENKKAHATHFSHLAAEGLYLLGIKLKCFLTFFFLNGRQHGTSPCCGGGPPEFQNPVRHFLRPGTRANGHCCVPEPALQEIATNLPLQGKAKSTRIMIYKLLMCILIFVLVVWFADV